MLPPLPSLPFDLILLEPCFLFPPLVFPFTKSILLGLGFSSATILAGPIPSLFAQYTQMTTASKQSQKYLFTFEEFESSSLSRIFSDFQVGAVPRAGSSSSAYRSSRIGGGTSSSKSYDWANYWKAWVHCAHLPTMILSCWFSLSIFSMYSCFLSLDFWAAIRFFSLFMAFLIWTERFSLSMFLFLPFLFGCWLESKD